jgi:hypothetical protein
MSFGTIVSCSWNSKYPFVNGDYNQFFPELKNYQYIDPLQSAADFYILFGLSNKSIVDFPTVRKTEATDVVKAAIKLGLSFEDLQKRNAEYYDSCIQGPSVKLTEITNLAEVSFNRLVDFLDQVFFQYVNAACGGELRHHKATLCIPDGSGNNSRWAAWNSWGRIYNSEGPDSLLEMETLFLDFNNGSYGGPPWAAATRLLYDRANLNLASSFKENITLFVDRVFNLQHNTGCFLNKLDWPNFRTDREACEDFRSMSNTVLAAHSADNPDLTCLYDRASSDVQFLLSNAIDLAKKHNLPINGIWKETQ